MSETEKQLNQFLLDHYNGHLTTGEMLKAAYALGVIKGEALVE